MRNSYLSSSCLSLLPVLETITMMLTSILTLTLTLTLILVLVLVPALLRTLVTIVIITVTLGVYMSLRTGSSLLSGILSRRPRGRHLRLGGSNQSEQGMISLTTYTNKVLAQLKENFGI